MARVRYWIGFAAVLSMAALFMTPTVQAQSVEESKASVEAMPDDPPRHYNLGRAFFKAGQFKESIASFEKAIELKEDKRDYYNMGLAQQKVSSNSAAIKSFKKAVGIDAGYADAHAALGGAYRKTKNTTSAIRAYKAAIKINPKKGTWHYNLGILYQTKEDYKNAIPAYEAYLKLRPKARNAKSIRDIVAQMKDAIK